MATRAKKPSDNHNRALTQVVTRAEAAQLWQRHPETIQYQIDRGRLAARRTGRGWLIAWGSLVDLYGPPVNRKKVLY